ncbi:DUF4340 domain-containing protein [Termitidicoccus mucosus]|uniref:DUF4340 domain-containing protein n=1 Tax=Termitidicoccus mucosus TaxID=1184151 RepID=UPI00318390EB
MNLKPLLIAVIVLALLSGITWFATRPPAPANAADDRTGESVVPADQVAVATRVTIAEGGKTVELVRGDDQAWRVASYYDLPADFPKLTRLVSQLTEAKIDRFVTADPERAKRLGFDGTQIVFRGADAAAAPLFSLELGRTAESGGRFIRRAGETRSYLAKLSLWLDTESKSWADSALVSIKPADITKVEFTFPDAPPLALARKDKDAPFAPEPAREGWKLKTSALDSQLDTLTALRFKDTAAPDNPDAADAGKHARTVTLTTFDNRTLALTMGRRPAVSKPAAPETTDTVAASGTAAPTEPKTEEIPAGPVYIQIADTKTDSPVAALMQKRAVEIYDYSFTGLPASPDALLEKEEPAAK